MTTENKYTPHPHADVIKAWADGKPIEYRYNTTSAWRSVAYPSFVKEYQYRVKPEEVVDYTIVTEHGTVGASYAKTIASLSMPGYYPNREIQGYCKRTTVDGKVVSLKFIPV